MDLDERKKRILDSVISSYIATGEPVGSKTLLDSLELGVSSATVRSEMNELEKLGYLCKPHTSAGRIPSEDGLRYYVKTSLNQYTLDERDLKMFMPAFRSCVGLLEMIRSASSCLAEFSGCTVFSASAAGGDNKFTFEVMPAGKRTLAIMAISDTGTVKSVFTKADDDVTAEDAQKLTKLLNKIFANFPVNQIGGVKVMLFRDEVDRNCPKMSCVVAPVISLVDKIKSYELYISGSEKLLSYPEFSNVEAAKEYFSLLSRHEDILGQLLEAEKNGDINVRIGEENKILKNLHASVISVGSDAKIPIVIGVLGPTRMNYSKVIAGCKHVMLSLQEHIDKEF
ncbi:MAG: heat-inducible transcriptional repressor HrcA [Eubacteriales bacterium]